MATIFKNPRLPDYFIEREPDENLLAEYEAGKVISLANVDLGIDHDFWAALPVNDIIGLKKTYAAADGGVTLAGSLARNGVPAELSADLVSESERVLSRVLPIYEKIFEGYTFTRRKVSWRLNLTLNENIHIDTYKQPSLDHFARMFINLDSQPRIWNTSYTLDNMYEMHGQAALDALADNATPALLHQELNARTFGLLSSHEWWDNKDRHVTYFDPGDVWVVDSRLISHQIFYGRRALSIDFFVDPASMLNPRRHYLAMAEDFIASENGRRAA
jgi:hypothetical protein